MELHVNKITPEVALLVGIDTGAYDCAVSLDELEELAHTAGAQVAAKISQSREKPDAGTCVGTGKLEEILEFCKNNEVDLLIFDCELTPVQQRNLEDKTELRVIDRTTLILDIFAAHALSNEGKLQVELAQLKYRLPRLTGKGAELSRLGGGIGTRGPGETKLETDRRHIRRQIKSLETQLEALGKRRSLARERRSKSGFETVAIVGYTNAGKSTLMNTLTQAGVLVEDKLFATLDPAARALVLPDGRHVMLVDTVGLIRRLPHNLVEAFKSTLEEAVGASVILNVCDVSSPDCAEHLAVTEKLLDELGCAGKPVISVLNKSDLLPSAADLPVIGQSVMISALEGRGIGKLLEAISAALPATHRKAELLIPYAAAAAAAEIRRDGVIYREEFHEDGLYLSVSADLRLLDRLKEYLI